MIRNFIIMLAVVVVMGILSNSTTKNLGNITKNIVSTTMAIHIMGMDETSSLSQIQTIGKDRITQEEHFSLWRLKIVKNTIVRLESEITAPENYKDVERVLQEATEGDVITFHLAGYGGRVDALTELVSNIHQSKAVINMIVDAPVYSTDAMLAVSGDTLKMNRNSLLMFHAPANILGKMTSQIDCSLLTGTDRGQPESDQCELDKQAQMRLDQQQINSLPYLTKQEKAAILEGKEVYLFPNDIKKRAK